jgi:hypothetical protein
VAGALLASGAAFPVQAQPAPLSLSPVDDASRRADFLTFRHELQETVRRRDADALLRIVHPGIKSSLGGNSGVDDFRAQWHPERADSELWRELGAVLALGGTFDEAGSFVAPYVFSRWPDAFDAFEHVAVIGSSVRVRAAPSASAAVVATVSYAILERDLNRAEVEGWTAVRLPGTQAGYVASQLARSPIDYRAYFTRENGRWLMALLLAGD